MMKSNVVGRIFILMSLEKYDITANDFYKHRKKEYKKYTKNFVIDKLIKLELYLLGRINDNRESLGKITRDI